MSTHPQRSQRRDSHLLVALLLLTGIAVLLWSPGRGSRAQQEPQRQLKRESTPQTAQRRSALVIGNGAYKNVKPLKNPPNDAILLAATLRKLGFEVTVGTDKTQREMKQMIREFGQRLRGGGGVGLFYFAGHGVQAKGHNYLIPVDAEIQTEADLEDAAVDVNYVLNMMDDAQNALNIAILDACRNNPFARSFRSTQDGLAQVRAPTGTLIAYATSPDSVAADGGGANSPYAEELTKNLQVSGVLLETMFRRVAEQVSSRSGGRQEPWFSANVKGDFFFSNSPAPSGVSSSGETTQPAKIDAVAVEREYWDTVRTSNDAQDYKDYLQAYPNGAYASVARTKIRQLEATKNTPLTTNPTNIGGNHSGAPAGATNPNSSLPKSFKSQQGIEMVYIPPGSFMMGSNNGSAALKPVHEVTISRSFYMGKYEVTQGQWQTVMGNNPSYFKDCNKDCPVEQVSWIDAQYFINRLNDANVDYRYRLPSEAEWEYACRSGTTGDYAGSLDSIAWYGNNSGNSYIDASNILKNDQSNYVTRLQNNGDRIHVVGTKQANSFGLYDMQGNVVEWCEDWWHESYQGAPKDGTAWLNGGEQKVRVLRGGHWGSVAYDLRSPGRSWVTSDHRNYGIGFRIVAVVRTQ